MNTETTRTEQELRELDAWIAEHVMVWSNGEDVGQFEIYPKYKQVWTRYTDTGKAVIFSPSTDQAAAMQVLEKCAEKWPVKISVEHDMEECAGESKWFCISAEDSSNLYIEAETLPLAISKFAKELFSK